MKDIDISEVFCEILSGLASIAVIVPFLDLIHISDVSSTMVFIGKHLDGVTIATGIAVSYFLGLIMDAVGLSIGECFLDGFICRESPSSQQIGAFWKVVPAHILQYRDTQWSYYSMYRNLFLLLIPGCIFWLLVIWFHFGAIMGLSVLAVTVSLEIAFWKTMKSLLKIYYTIAQYIGEK